MFDPRVVCFKPTVVNATLINNGNNPWSNRGAEDNSIFVNGTFTIANTELLDIIGHRYISSSVLFDIKCFIPTDLNFRTKEWPVGLCPFSAQEAQESYTSKMRQALNLKPTIGSAAKEYSEVAFHISWLTGPEERCL